VAITLAQAQVNTQDDVDFTVIDNLRRNSWLLNNMVFDDTVTPGTGGGSLTYAWTQLSAAAGAAYRAMNSEYTPGQATRTRPASVVLVPMGGNFQIDRVLANLGPSATSEVTFQIQQLTKSIRTYWQDQFINGDTSVTAAGFNGINKTLTGSAGEYLPINNGFSTGYLDWSAATVNSENLAMSALDVLDDALAQVVPSQIGLGDGGALGEQQGGTKAILGNTKSITRIRSLARKASQYTTTQDSLGNLVEMYGEWALVNLGDKLDGSAPIVPIQTRDADGAGPGGNITGLTDIYAVSLGLDSIHAASVAGNPLVRTWLPPMDLPGAVKNGEVELGPSAVIVKNVRSAVVLRNVKVQ
jgi:hypothetical protein